MTGFVVLLVVLTIVALVSVDGVFGFPILSRVPGWWDLWFTGGMADHRPVRPGESDAMLCEQCGKRLHMFRESHYIRYDPQTGEQITDERSFVVKCPDRFCSSDKHPFFPQKQKQKRSDSSQMLEEKDGHMELSELLAGMEKLEQLQEDNQAHVPVQRILPDKQPPSSTHTTRSHNK